MSTCRCIGRASQSTDRGLMYSSPDKVFQIRRGVSLGLRRQCYVVEWLGGRLG